jgi:hypothetical protein
MRNNSQCRNSTSLDSSNNDASLASRSSSLTIDKLKREENIRLFRTPRFFQSIPNTGLEKSSFLFLEKYVFLCFRWINDNSLIKLLSTIIVKILISRHVQTVFSSLIKTYQISR